MREPARGSWSRSIDGIYQWKRLDTCKWLVGTRAEFFSAFAGRRLVFIGDSQVRELVYMSVAYLGNCCSAQYVTPCNETAVLDIHLCKTLAERGVSYPAVPLVLDLYAGDGRGNVTLVYIWLGYAIEASTNETVSESWVTPFLNGEFLDTKIDGILMSFGHWNLIFDQNGKTTSRSDSAAGLTILEIEAAALSAAFAQGELKHPGLLTSLIWMRMPPDEVDAFPHPQHKKRMIMPIFREQAVTSLSHIMSKIAANEWIVTDMLDVRAGNVTRPFNENMLTYDGMHYHKEVNVALSWELFSWWATRENSDDGDGNGMRRPSYFADARRANKTKNNKH